MSYIRYFIFDATHPAYPFAKGEGENAQTQWVSPNSQLSLIYNNDNTKGAAKIVGAYSDWYETGPWFEHPMVLEHYKQDEVDQYRTSLQTPEWGFDNSEPEGGSPLI